MMPSLLHFTDKVSQGSALGKELKEKDQWMKIKSGTDWLRELDPYKSTG